MNSLSSFSSDDSGHLTNSEILYSKIQRVYIKVKHKEERQRDLRVNVELITGVSPVCQQTLSLQLMDDEDSFFLYSLSLTEDDFKHLKSDQGLLVDFDNFSSHFIKLLEMSRNGSESPCARFLLILEEEDTNFMLESRQSSLKVVETNNFKHLCHLSLKISGANDMELKKHMAVKIKQLKDAVLKFEKQVSNSECQVNELQQKFAAKCLELEKLHQRWNEEKSEFHVNSMRELTQEREKLAQIQLECQRKIERERLELEEKHCLIERGLENQVSQLKVQNQVLSEKLRQVESINKEQEKQIDDLGRELSRIHEECTRTQKQNAKLDTEYHEKEKAVIALQKKVSSLEQELEKKTVAINRQNNQLCVMNQEKEELEHRLKEKDTKMKSREISLQSLSEDLIKANQIISKLQVECGELHNKVKMREKIILKQENTLKETEMKLQTSKGETYSQAEKIGRLESIEKQLREALLEVNRKLEEREKTLKSNENVISYMSSEMNKYKSALNIPPNGRLTMGSSAAPTMGQFSVSSTRPTGIQSYLQGRTELRPPSSIPLPISSSLPLPSTSSISTGVGVVNTTASNPALSLSKDSKPFGNNISDKKSGNDRLSKTNEVQKTQDFMRFFRSTNGENAPKTVAPIPSAYFRTTT